MTPSSTPDLSKLRIDGYEIEQAVFVDENADAPIVLQPAFVDMTAPDNGRIVEYLPSPGVVILDWPTGRIPQIGTVLGDTAFGGLLRRVTKVEANPQPGEVGKRWILTTVEADITEAVLSGDFTFATRLDLNQVLPDLDRAEEVSGYLPDGKSNYAESEYSLRGTRILFQPAVTGRMRVQGGKVEDFSLRVQGDCEVMADVRGAFHGRGDFDYEDELPSRPPQVLPLGNGLFLRVQSRPSIRMEASVAGEGLSAQAGFRIVNSIRGDLVYSRDQWRPMAENRMTQAGQAVKELWGEGNLRLAIKPRMEFLLAGVQGPAFTFEPFARFSSTQDSVSGAPAVQRMPPAAAGTPAGADPEAGLLGHGNKELSPRLQHLHGDPDHLHRPAPDPQLHPVQPGAERVLPAPGRQPRGQGRRQQPRLALPPDLSQGGTLRGPAAGRERALGDPVRRAAGHGPACASGTCAPAPHIASGPWASTPWAWAPPSRRRASPSPRRPSTVRLSSPSPSFRIRPP